MVWYKELGFSNNPFSIKPGAFSSEIIGYDLSEILKKIEDSKVLFIEGEYGFGKTSILKHIIRQFGGRKKVAYYNCNRADESINTGKIIKGSKGFIGRLFGVVPSGLILLLDEVERISQNDQKDLLEQYQAGHLKSVVFFGPDFDKISFSIELRKLMVNNVIKLTELTDNEMVQLVRERVGTLKLLDDRIIKAVFRNSSNNPRLTLENLEDVVKYAVDNNEDEVTDEHLKEVLGIAPSPSKDIKPKKKATPKKKQIAEKKAEPRVLKVEKKPKAKKSKPEPAAEEPKPKLVKPKHEQPTPKPKPSPPEKSKPAKQEEPKSKKERGHVHHEKPEEDFEDKKSKKKLPPYSVDFEEETDYSEPAEEDPGEDDKGGEYYYYY